jgi:ABC-type sugar transport system substrate-binding protein
MKGEAAMNKRLAALPILVAAIAATAGLLASTSSGAPKAQRTIGLIVPAPGSSIASYFEQGGQAAAASLGDRLAITEAADPSTEIRAIEALIAQHVAAIAVDNERDDSGVSEALAQARGAGIPTLSFENRYPGSLWVSGSSPAQYAHALADALASQMNQRGQFIIVPCAPANPIVGTWLRLIKPYVQHRYPRMHRVGVVTGGDGNGPAGTLLLRPLLRKHPHLRGLIFLCQDEAYNGPLQLIHQHEVGRVFSSGNGESYAPPVVEPWRTFVRVGAEEIVCPDAAKLGYLAVWASDQLAGGKKLAPGTYNVGGPVGTVHYYGHNQELRLGQPLTITRANLDQYGIQR